MQLRLHMVKTRCRSLGPGCRYCLWVQGCDHHCEGCISPESHATGGTVVEVEDLAAQIESAAMANHIDGLTISGGEPFLQAEALIELIRLVRAYLPDLNILLFSGRTHAELKDDPLGRALLDSVDMAILGPYEKDKDPGVGLPGSTNQEVVIMGAGLVGFDPWKWERCVEVFPTGDNDSFAFAGVPTKAQLRRLHIVD